MSKLTKEQVKLHRRACEYLQKDVLNYTERLFVIENWHEGAEHNNTPAGAFFTPFNLARDFTIEVNGSNIIDLCAGIGALAFAVFNASPWGNRPAMTCVEINPAYVAVGRKVLPEATWIVGDVLSLPSTLTGFDFAISNPPFGRIRQTGQSPRYKGSEFEYKVIDVASDLAEFGVFILPQSSAPFRYSGRPHYEPCLSEKYQGFSDATGIELNCNCGIDTSVHLKDWRQVSVSTEIVCVDFPRRTVEHQTASEGWEQASLFPFSPQPVLEYA